MSANVCFGIALLVDDNALVAGLAYPDASAVLCIDCKHSEVRGILHCRVVPILPLPSLPWLQSILQGLAMLGCHPVVLEAHNEFACKF